MSSNGPTHPDLNHPANEASPAQHRQRELALVTGASTGIGLELAKELAAHGFDLLVAAENRSIFDAAHQLARSGVSVEPIQVDLATPAGVDEVHTRIKAAGRPLDVAVLNAGIGTRGAFATDTQLETELQIVDLNVRSTMHLAKHVVCDMAQRGAGRILITSSVAANEPGAFQAVYNASKSFVQSFSLALQDELAGTGVTVTTLMPGPTDTPFFERANIPRNHVASLRVVSAHEVARAGFKAMLDGERIVVTVPPAPRTSQTKRLRRRAGRLFPSAAKNALRRTIHKSPSA